MRIRSLPRNGTLYYNAQTGSQFLLGARVVVGDVIPALTGYFCNLLYIGNANYSNSLVYDVLPNQYVSLLDQYGHPVQNGTGTDFFTYDAQSGINSSYVTSMGTYNVYVEDQAIGQLTVCSRSGSTTSVFNTSCTSFGLESNTLYPQTAIPIYLNVNYTLGESVYYTINSLPAHGILYFNEGNLSQSVIGAVVKVNDVILYNDDGVADMIYIGNDDYFNDIVYLNTNYLRVFVDKKNVPIGACFNSVKFGCPDTFAFSANTSSGRVSNPGTYQIYVDSLISDANITGPAFLQYVPNVKYYFLGKFGCLCVFPLTNT